MNPDLPGYEDHYSFVAPGGFGSGADSGQRHLTAQAGGATAVLNGVVSSSAAPPNVHGGGVWNHHYQDNFDSPGGGHLYLVDAGMSWTFANGSGHVSQSAHWFSSWWTPSAGTHTNSGDPSWDGEYSGELPGQMSPLGQIQAAQAGNEAAHSSGEINENTYQQRKAALDAKEAKERERLQDPKLPANQRDEEKAKARSKAAQKKFEQWWKYYGGKELYEAGNKDEFWRRFALLGISGNVGGLILQLSYEDAQKAQAIAEFKKNHKGTPSDPNLTDAEREAKAAKAAGDLADGILAKAKENHIPLTADEERAFRDGAVKSAIETEQARRAAEVGFSVELPLKLSDSEMGEIKSQTRFSTSHGKEYIVVHVTEPTTGGRIRAVYVRNIITVTETKRVVGEFGDMDVTTSVPENDGWRLFGVVPGSLPLKAVHDYVDREDSIRAAAFAEGFADFVIHMTPIAGTVDYAQQGAKGESLISAAGDFLLVGGQVVKILRNFKYIKGLSAAEHALHGARVATDGAIVLYRVGQQVHDGKVDAAKTGEIVLRLVSIALGVKDFRAYCFPAGTPVATEHGLRPIEDVKVGDLVWACDLTTGAWALKPVERLLQHLHHGVLSQVEFEGETLEATPDHPFWVLAGANLAARPKPKHVPAVEPDSALPGRGVDAGDLRPGDLLQLRDGRRVPIRAVRTRPADETVYNFAVADLHTFAVGRAEALVHNRDVPTRFEGPKPRYVINPAHVPGTLRKGKTPLPSDAEAAFRRAVPGDGVNPRA